MIVGENGITLGVGDQDDWDPRRTEVADIEAATAMPLDKAAELITSAARQACGQVNCCLDVTTSTDTLETGDTSDPTAWSDSAEVVRVVSSCSREANRTKDCAAGLEAATKLATSVFSDALALHAEAEVIVANINGPADERATTILEEARTQADQVQTAAASMADRAQEEVFGPLRARLMSGQAQS